MDDCLWILENEKQELNKSAQRLRAMGSSDLFHDREVAVKAVDQVTKRVSQLKYLQVKKG